MILLAALWVEHDVVVVHGVRFAGDVAEHVPLAPEVRSVSDDVAVGFNVSDFEFLVPVHLEVVVVAVIDGPICRAHVKSREYDGGASLNEIEHKRISNI